MKLTKSKQFLANAIHASGNGWPDGANWAAQDGSDGAVSFFSGSKPEYIAKDKEWLVTRSGCRHLYGSRIKGCSLAPNWHQTVLIREEYFSAYPAEPAADADGWIEWKGGKCPVERGTLVDVKYSGGEENFGVSALTEGWQEDHVRGSNGNRSAVNWVDALPVSGIVAYRLHKPEPAPAEKLSPEAVMDAKAALMGEGIEDCVRKPTIEQLTADYRNKLDFANRKQQEADDAKSAADAALGELVAAGKAIDLVIGIAKPEPELVITDWRDLRVGDEVECIKDNIGNKYSGVIGVVQKIDYDDTSTPVCVDIDEVGRIWCHEVKFIRRP